MTYAHFVGTLMLAFAGIIGFSVIGGLAIAKLIGWLERNQVKGTTTRNVIITLWLVIALVLYFS